MAKKGTAKLNRLIEREFRKAIPIKVIREFRSQKDGSEVEVIYVMLGDTRYRMALAEHQMTFSALGQPLLTIDMPDDMV